MSTTTEIQRVNVTEVTEIMAGAGLILDKNENLALKAVKGAEELLDTIEGQGMSEEIDAALNAWQVKAKEAIGLMNMRRSPITQIMTRIAKHFTELENKLDPSKSESVYSKVQAQRNAWAKQKAIEAKEKEAEILKQQNIAKEKVSFKALVETHIRTIYNGKLLTFKQHAVKIYNNLTIQNVAEVKAAINDVKVNYPLDAFNKIEPASAVAYYLPAEDQNEIIVAVRDNLYDELSANFRENMEAEKERLLDLIPSRVNELKEIAKAGEAKKKELEAEAERRRVADDLRQKQEAAAQEAKDKANIAANIQMETATTLFDTAAQLAQVKEESTGKAREGYKINVLNAAGWGAIFMFYFEKEGQKLDVETFGKKSLNQMKTFCEKHAMKENEQISSDALQYEEVFKAVATKG